MRARDRIESYLQDLLGAELREHERYGADRFTLFACLKCREFVWTFSRLLGLAHRHDGAGRRGLDERPLFPGEPAGRSVGSGRILLDVTASWRYSFRTGVQRVAREMARAAVESGKALPVVIDGGRVYSFYRHAELPDEIHFSKGDRLVVLDANWGFAGEYPPLIDRLRRSGGEVVGVLYDIIPLLYPAAVMKHNGAAFRRWFDEVLMPSDALVAISRSVAEDCLACAGARAPSRIGYWPLGADFARAGTPPSRQARNIAEDASAFFMSVGTLEPRKGYTVALAAFDSLWREGVDARYIIVGRPGWNMRAVERAIREHAEYGRRLVWLDNCNDADLHYLYSRARALVFASFAEGFGLPLVEAAFHGAPVIASDIPVFRELGGDGVDYFDLLDPHSLATRLKAALSSVTRPGSPKGASPGTPPGIASSRIVSWRESMSALAALIEDDAYQFRGARAEADPPQPNDALTQLEARVCALDEAALDPRWQRRYERLAGLWRTK